MKGSLWFLASVLCSAGPALASDYVYDISSAPGPFISSGDIVTTCDHCVLTSADVVAWSLNVDYAAIGLPPAGSPFTSSSLPKSSLQVLGSELTATPSGVFFNFHEDEENSTAIVTFSSGAHSVQLYNFPQSPGSPPGGALEDCIANGCAGDVPNTNMELASFTKLAAPELDARGLGSAMTLLLSGLAILMGRARFHRR